MSDQWINHKIIVLWLNHNLFFSIKSWFISLTTAIQSEDILDNSRDAKSSAAL